MIKASSIQEAFSVIELRNVEREGFEPEERVRKRPEAVSTEREAALPRRGGGPKAWNQSLPLRR